MAKITDKNFKDLAGKDNLEGETGAPEDNFKKGTPNDLFTGFNYLPPGQNISDQVNSDIRELKLKTIVSPSGYHPFGS